MIILPTISRHIRSSSNRAAAFLLCLIIVGIDFSMTTKTINAIDAFVNFELCFLMSKLNLFYMIFACFFFFACNVRSIDSNFKVEKSPERFESV